MISKLIDFYKSNNINYYLLKTEYQNHAQVFCKNNNLKKYKDIIVCGGDGTFNEVINGLMLNGSSVLQRLGFLPGGTGKKIKVAVVCEDNKAQDAKDAGADIVGGDEFVEKIKGGELNFEKLICTPGMMIKLSKLGKVLGPKGLMPNPKLGSVSENIKEAVTNAKSGQVEIRNDKDGNIGVSIGKKSFSDDQLLKNYNAILDALEKEKSNNTLKGDLIRSVFATSTMGVSYKVKLGKSI